MISRYALYAIGELSNRFSIADGVPKGVKPQYSISPTVNAPVIINDKGTYAIQLMKWGLVAKGAKDTNSVFRYKTYNVPSENILSRHSWDRAVRESRCLLPANGFYELNGSGKKHAYYIQPKDESLFAFAGIHGTWEDPEGTVHHTFSMITIDATNDMPGSSTRMPVIIRQEDEARWLDPTITDTSSLYDMLRPYPSELLVTHEVSADIYSPKPNHPRLIEPI